MIESKLHFFKITVVSFHVVAVRKTPFDASSGKKGHVTGAVTHSYSQPRRFSEMSQMPKNSIALWSTVLPEKLTGPRIL